MGNRVMSFWEKFSVVTSVCLMLLSGVTYLVTKYGLEKEDPFSVINHPLEPVALKIHILLGPLLIFLFGVLFQSHMRGRFKPNFQSARGGGLLTAILFVLTASSGYLLQILDQWVFREIFFYLHVIGGLSFGLTFGFHSYQLVRRIRKTGPALPEDSRHMVQPGCCLIQQTQEEQVK